MAILTIIDFKTQRLFALPTLGKIPLVQLVDAFLTCYGLQVNDLRAIRTDQGGELACSAAFQEVVAKHNYVLELTGADAASENSLGEKPNDTLSVIRRLLYMSGLPPTHIGQTPACTECICTTDWFTLASI